MELQTQVFHEKNVAINEQFDFAEELSDMLWKIEGLGNKPANTTGTMSTNVGGVQHMLGPGSAGWLASSATNGRASFDFSPYNIGVKNLWQFKYYQSAYSSTRLSNLSLRINWEYDIRNTNYELFY